MITYTIIENILLWGGLGLFYGVALIFIVRYSKLKRTQQNEKSERGDSDQQNTIPTRVVTDYVITEPGKNSFGIAEQREPSVTPMMQDRPRGKSRLSNKGTALIFNNVTKNFRLDENTTITPVRNINLEIARGEFVVILGRSGTGKTTLLNLAAGLVRPTSGSVHLDGENLGNMSQEQLSEIRRKKLGFMFQFPSLIPALTIKDNISLPAMFGGKSGNGAAERTIDLLRMLGLSEKLDVYPRQLSAGETKRVVVARSLINEPQIILADEPTSDLDSRTEKEVLQILRDINETGVTFLIVTHSMPLMPFATRAFEMDHGGLREISTSKYSESPVELA